MLALHLGSNRYSTLYAKAYIWAIKNMQYICIIQTHVLSPCKSMIILDGQRMRTGQRHFCIGTQIHGHLKICLPNGVTWLGFIQESIIRSSLLPHIYLLQSLGIVTASFSLGRLSGTRQSSAWDTCTPFYTWHCLCLWLRQEKSQMPFESIFELNIVL